MKLTLITINFNDLSTLKQIINKQQPNTTLIQHTHQQPQNNYILTNILTTLHTTNIPTLTNNNYTIIKITQINYKYNTNISTFSYFKLFKPKNINTIINNTNIINHIHTTLYSNNNQIQNTQTLKILHNLIFTPIIHTIQTKISKQLLTLLNNNTIPKIKNTIITNTQSKILIIKFHQPITTKILKKTQKHNTLPYPINTKSKYKIPPLFYHLSKTFHQTNPQSKHYTIHINPNHNNKKTILQILHKNITNI